MEKSNNKKWNLVIDFDSTFIKFEALEELATIALENNPQKREIVAEIGKITVMGMEGKITFPDSLSRRLKLFSTKKDHIDILITKLRKNISDSIERNKEFFIDNADRIYVISGGFEDFISPVVAEFGIKHEHILANKFLFDESGNVVGIDERRALAQESGKIKAVDSMEFSHPVCVVGDGWTDYEIRQAGSADLFCAFCENIEREVVVKKADYVTKDFSDVISWINSINL